MTLQERLTALAQAIGADMKGKAPSVHAHADATPSAAGFMSAQDKAKLDALSITVSATAPTNPNIGDLWVDTSP